MYPYSLLSKMLSLVEKYLVVQNLCPIVRDYQWTFLGVSLYRYTWVFTERFFFSINQPTIIKITKKSIFNQKLLVYIMISSPNESINNIFLFSLTISLKEYQILQKSTNLPTLNFQRRVLRPNRLSSDWAQIWFRMIIIFSMKY